MQALAQTIGIFLSYNHVDKEVAKEIHSQLIKVSSQVNVFLDHVSLQGGDIYEEKIAQAIHHSRWFILLFLGNLEKDMTWCFYEAGQFRARVLAATEQLGESRTPRMCALFDGDAPPRQIAQFQATKISERDDDGNRIELDRKSPNFDEVRLERTPLYRLLMEIVRNGPGEPLRDLVETASQLRECARAIIKAVLDHQTGIALPEESLQPHIAFTIPRPPTNEGLDRIEPETVVNGYDKALRDIFGITSDKTTWGTLRNAAISLNETLPLWLQDVEENVCKKIALNFEPEQTRMLCTARGGGGVYRPVLTRFVPYYGGRKDVYIIFVRTKQMPRTPTGIAEQIGLLFVTLIMALRFRQWVLPFLDSVEIGDLPKKLIKLERDIGLIEDEAREYGFVVARESFDPQPNPLFPTIADSKDRETLKGLAENYDRIRSQIMRSVQAVKKTPTPDTAQNVLASIVGELRQLKDMNAPFISIVVKELGKRHAEILRECDV